jgi:hypothetical protein
VGEAFGQLDLTLFVLALWGLAGAAVYGAPRWAMCVKVCRKEADDARCCHEDVIIHLIVGAIAGAAAGPYIADMLSQTQPHQVRALTAFIGLVANRAAPGLIKLFSAKETLTSILQLALKTVSGGKA